MLRNNVDTYDYEIGAHSVLQVARRSPHMREVANKTSDTLPTFQLHHMFFRTVAESKTQLCITLVETRSGAMICFTCGEKWWIRGLDTRKTLCQYTGITGVCRKVVREIERERER